MKSTFKKPRLSLQPFRNNSKLDVNMNGVTSGGIQFDETTQYTEEDANM